MSLRSIALILMMTALPFSAAAQYPSVPDSVKARAAAQLAVWDSLDAAAWERAYPIVMHEAHEAGRPYVPWASEPDDLVQADLPAFPGAEGPGRFTPGGRGGRVYVITSLDDDGPGSLREACEAGGARIVVFNVAGEIRLERPLHIRAPYITIAGQTAPGDGVVVTGHTFEIDTHDVVVRYMRFRRGAMDVAHRDDACGGHAVGNIILDHCSASWGLDEVMSLYRHVYEGQKMPTLNITIQDCIFAEGLDLYNHAFGASIGGHGTLFVRNLFSCNISRNPSVAMDGDFNFVNNVLFNWWNRSIDGGDERSRFNIVNNYLKPGPATGASMVKSRFVVDTQAPIRHRILKPEASRDKTRAQQFGRAYVAGNIVEGNDSVTADNWAGGVQLSGISDAKRRRALLDSIRLCEPLPLPYLDSLMSADEAYDYVLTHVGATKPHRDYVDMRILRGVESGLPEYAADALPHESPYVRRRLPADSYRYGIITDPQQVGGLPRYLGRPRRDTDGDGIPDWWERARGLNPNDPTDATRFLRDGYMVIEAYINSL